MLAQFYWNPVQVGKTDDGLPRYEDQIFVKITRDVTHTVNRRAEEKDYERFPGELAYFKKATAAYEPIKDCLPLEFWPVALPADVMNLKGHGIRSVQDLAKADPRKMPSVFSSLVEHAKNYMKVAGSIAKSTELITHLTDENAQLKEDLALSRADADALRRSLSKEKAA